MLGEHWRRLGYESLQAFVNAQYGSEAAQLDTMARFIVANGLDGAVRRGSSTPASWEVFARGYNGSSYARHNYHQRLASAFKRLAQSNE